jgi:ubiquitin-protein ligase E3 C
VRALWTQRYGEAGQAAAVADLGSGQPFLRELLFFADASSPADGELIAAACRLALTPHGPAGRPGLCATAGEGAAAAAVIVLRAQRLATLATDCMAAQLGSLLPALRAPRQVGAGPIPAAASCLVDAVAALTSSQAWAASLGGPGAPAAAAAQVLAHLCCRGLFSQLARIVEAACPEAAAAARAPALAETLCTAVVVRYFAAQGAAAKSPRVQLSAPSVARLSLSVSVSLFSAASPPHAATAAASFFADLVEQRVQPSGALPPPEGSTPSALLCVPALLQRCASLRPVASRLWRHAVAALHPLTAPQLAAWLPAELLPEGRAGAAAALLGNLLEGAAGAAPAAAAAAPSQASAGRLQALQFLQVSGTLLSLLPVALFRRAPSAFEQEEEEEDDGGGGGEAEAAAAGAAALPWPEEHLPPAPVLAQLQLVSDGATLAACVRAALPAASAADAPAPGDAAAVATAAAAARQLCAYLARVTRLPGHRRRAVIGLALPAGLVQRLWFSFLRAAHASGGLGAAAFAPAADAASQDPGWMLPLALLCEAFSLCFVVAGDEGLYERQQPLALEELRGGASGAGGALALLKAALWQVLWADVAPPAGGRPPAAAALRARLARAAGRLMGQLHDRNGRRPFAPAEAFAADGLPPERFHAEVAAGAAAGRDAEDPGASRAWGLLAHAPFLVPFVDRARVFARLVGAEREAYRSRDDAAAVFGAAAPRRFVSVRRGRVLADAFAALGSAPPEELRGRLRVAFVAEGGWEEAGVDGGGLFKEFLEELVKEGFSPEAGLFRATADNRLYPAPLAAAPDPRAAARMLDFLGRVLGKALWEGILVELPLAPFFLRRLRGGVCDIDDLPTLDPQLARNLASLKSLGPGEVADLGLSFAVTDDVAGRPVEVELVPGGRGLEVTSANAGAYVAAVADHRLNAQLRGATAAFAGGLHALIPREWVALFNDRELQELVGGAEGGAGLDLADMRAHVVYAGGYDDAHPAVAAFWEALAGLTPAQQADFLRFVTACPRPPLLGFAHLQPPLAIQMAGGGEEGRLPTAATCMNLLKLPAYSGGGEAVRRKLVYAIEAKAGFELS